MSQRVAGFGTTVFVEINNLARQFDAVNLGQGAPDFDGPPEILAAAVEAVNGAFNQYAPGIGMPTVREAIAALRARQPMQQLRWSKGLAGAAADHVKDQGPIGGLEHRGTDGSNPARRAERRGRWVTAMAENIAFGDNPARQVVIQLLVDDGIPDRGHRDNILDSRWGAEGAACGPHRDYRQICVMDYAVRYVER